MGRPRQILSIQQAEAGGKMLPGSQELTMQFPLLFVRNEETGCEQVLVLKYDCSTLSHCFHWVN